jgi:hypothetical protein
VPYKPNDGLRQWVFNQRRDFKHGTLKPERMARLDRVGFQWDRKTAMWNGRYRKLEAYHVQHRHCNVPRRYGADPSLRQWVIHQRKALNNGTLTLDRVARLNRLGFQATHGPPGTPQAGTTRDGSEKA